MRNQHIVVTGATAGIGRASALELARRGAKLTLLCRNMSRGEALAGEIAAQGQCEPPELVEMNMADLSSVRRAATEIARAGAPVDVLLNNAGIVNTEPRETIDGYEETFAVNHLAPFLLTGMLLPLLNVAPAARVVNVASEAYKFVRSMELQDIHCQQGFKTFRAYGRSKLANILFTRELAHRLENTPVTVNCLHPGAVSTALGTQNPGFFSTWLPRLLKPFFRTPAQGAATSLYLCSSDEVAGVSGRYFVNCQEEPLKSWATDDTEAGRLWRFSEQCVGFEYPSP